MRRASLCSALAISIVISGCGGSAGACVEEDPFDCYFELEASIPLSEEVLLGHIQYLDVDQGGRMIVTDLVGGEVHLFGRDGAFVRTLDAEPCHPGFVMRPIRAMFEPSGDILLLNSGPWGYRFNADGTCKSGVDPAFTAPRQACFSEDGLLNGYHQYPQEMLKTWHPDGTLVRDITVPQPPFPRYASHTQGGGLLCAPDGRLILAHTTSPEFTVYGNDGARLAAFALPPSFYSPIERDIVESGEIPAMIESMHRAREGKTTMLSIHLLTTDIILAHYWHAGEMRSVDLLRMDGTRVSEDAMPVQSEFHFAARGRAYRIVQPDATSPGNAPNPVVEVYRLRDEYVMR